jgi:hypothetical protein
MKLIIQIAAGVILGWLGIQLITAMETAIALRAITEALPSVPATPFAHRSPTTTTPTPAGLPPGVVALHEIPKPCQITTANGVTHYCQPPYKTTR